MLTCVGITRVPLPFHVCFLLFVALKRISSVLEEVTVYLQPVFFLQSCLVCVWVGAVFVLRP